MTDKNQKLEKAKKRVEEIKGFYTHLLVYILVNLFLLLIASNIFDGIASFHVPGWSYFTTPFFWGIGLLFHGLYVFQFKSGFLKKWEERKIREIMDKDEEEMQKFE
jgi:hypothetical protein